MEKLGNTGKMEFVLFLKLSCLQFSVVDTKQKGSATELFAVVVVVVVVVVVN